MDSGKCLKREAVILDVSHNLGREAVCDKLVNLLFAVNLNGCHPAKVVETDVFDFCIVAYDFLCIVEHINRNVAKTDTLNICVVENVLCNDT